MLTPHYMFFLFQVWQFSLAIRIYRRTITTVRQLWCSQKIERVTVASTMEADLLAIMRGLVALEWLHHFREECGYPETQPALLFTDSLSSIKFIENTGTAPNRQTRHLRRRVVKIRENIARNMVVLKFVPGALNCADVLTKPLGRVLHFKHCNNLQGYDAAVSGCGKATSRGESKYRAYFSPMRYVSEVVSYVYIEL